MLDTFIIDEIRRRERERVREERPVLELPLPPAPPARSDDGTERPEQPGTPGNVVIIDYTG